MKETVALPSRYRKHFGHHWFRHTQTGETQVMQWNPGSQTFTHSNCHDTALGQAQDMAGWDWVGAVPHPDDLEETQQALDALLEAVEPYVVREEPEKGGRDADLFQSFHALTNIRRRGLI